MEYDKETLDKVTQFGVLGYSLSKILNILDIQDKRVFLEDFDNKDTALYKSYAAGMDKADFVIDSKLYEKAKLGDLKAVQMFIDRKNTNLQKAAKEYEYRWTKYIPTDDSDD